MVQSERYQRKNAGTVRLKQERPQLNFTFSFAIRICPAALSAGPPGFACLGQREEPVELTAPHSPLPDSCGPPSWRYRTSSEFSSPPPDVKALSDLPLLS